MEAVPYGGGGGEGMPDDGPAAGGEGGIALLPLPGIMPALGIGAPEGCCGAIMGTPISRTSVMLESLDSSKMCAIGFEVTLVTRSTLSQ